MLSVFSVKPLYGIVQPKGAPGNLVELFDFIYRVEDFGAVHCLDVINATLRHPRPAL